MKIVRLLLVLSLPLLLLVFAALATAGSSPAQPRDLPVCSNKPKKISPVVVTSPRYADFVLDAKKAEKAAQKQEASP